MPLFSVLAYISVFAGEGDLKNVVSLTFRLPTLGYTLYTLANTLGMTSSRPPHKGNVTSVHSEIRTSHAQAKHVVYLFNLAFKGNVRYLRIFIFIQFFFLVHIKVQVTVTSSKKPNNTNKKKISFSSLSAVYLSRKIASLSVCYALWFTYCTFRNILKIQTYKNT